MLFPYYCVESFSVSSFSSFLVYLFSKMSDICQYFVLFLSFANFLYLFWENCCIKLSTLSLGFFPSSPVLNLVLFLFVCFCFVYLFIYLGAWAKKNKTEDGSRFDKKKILLERQQFSGCYLMELFSKDEHAQKEKIYSLVSECQRSYAGCTENSHLNAL